MPRRKVVVNLQQVMREVEIRMAAYTTVLEYVNSYVAGTLTAEEAMDQITVEMAQAVELMNRITGESTPVPILTDGGSNEASAATQS